MNLMAKKPFYLSSGIGIFKNIEQPGYTIKILGYGVSGLVVGECDNGFNLVNLTNYEKQELILSVLAKLRIEFYKGHIERFNPRMLTSHYKLTKTLNIDI